MLLAALAVVIAAAIAQIVIPVHGHLPPGGYALLGAVAGVALVGVAKALAALGLQRPLSQTRDE